MAWSLLLKLLGTLGKLLYFTKPRAGWDSTPPSEWEPVDWDNSEPKGTLNVVSDVLELVHWDQVCVVHAGPTIFPHSLVRSLSRM